MGLFNSKREANGKPLETEAPPTANPTTTTAANPSRRDSNVGRRPGAGFLGLRGLEILLAILILGLVAYAEHVYGNTFLRSAYVPALVAAVLTIVVTILRMFSAPFFRFTQMLHPLSAAGIDLFFALLWLAIMAELAAYSDVSAPKDVTYYGGIEARQVNGAYDTYTGTLKKLKRAWACGAAAAAFAGIEFVLFFVTAVLPLRHALRSGIDGTAVRQDSVGVPTSKRNSGSHAGQAPLAPAAQNTAEPGYEMRNTGTGEVVGQAPKVGQSPWERFPARDTGTAEGARPGTAGGQSVGTQI